MTRWSNGAGTIEALLSERRLQQVTPSREHADVLLAQAQRHLAAADQIAQMDPAGAYQLLYDAARKSLAAVLENQGLRATSEQGHKTVFQAVQAQLDPPLGQIIKPFNRMRRLRNVSEYPSLDDPEIELADAGHDSRQEGSTPRRSGIPSGAFPSGLSTGADFFDGRWSETNVPTPQRPPG